MFSEPIGWELLAAFAVLIALLALNVIANWPHRASAPRRREEADVEDPRRI